MSGADLDVVIVGGGPKGVSLALHLWRAGLRDLLLIEKGDIVGTWDSAKAGTSPTRTGIYFSDTLVPGDSEVGPLEVFARESLSDEDYARDHLPKETLQEYYREAAAAADLPVRVGVQVLRAEPLRAGYRLVLDDGNELTTRCLVDATGVVHSKRWPWWVRDLPPARYWHSIGHGVLNDGPGLRLLVVGGGHATPDIAVRMAELGGRITVCVRNHRLRQHLLPYSEQFLSPSFQRAYRRFGPRQRQRLLWQIARRGPWVTPRSFRELVDFMSKQAGEHGGTIEVALNCRVEMARWRNGAIQVQLSNGQVREVDGIICATGFQARVPEVTGFAMPHRFWAGRAMDGYPLIDDQYRLAQTEDFFVIGYLAQLGSRGPIDSILYDSQATTRTVAAALRATLGVPAGQRMAASRSTGVEAPA
jgi:cation diffusion facilitator CzcD-associated flavoprotein CzcO